MHRNYSLSPNDEVEARPSAARGARLEALESIRGLAALVVVVGHLALAFFPYALVPRNNGNLVLAALTQTPLRILLDGGFAVSVFFVLSGVVLSLAYFQRPSYEALSSATIRRYFRLAPPIVFSVLVGYSLLVLGWYFNQPLGAAFGQAGTWLHTWYDFEPNLADALREGFLCLVTFDYDIRHTYNGVLWTMPVEMFGSLLVFATLALVGSLRRRVWIYLAVGAVLYVTGRTYLNFIVGIALCDAFVADRRREKPLELHAMWGAVLILFGLGIASLRIGWFTGEVAALVSRFHHDLKTVGATIVIGVALFSPFWRRVLERPTLVSLGRISFALYLLHLPILCSLGCCSFLVLHGMRYSIETAGLIASGLVVATSLFAARCSYAWIDRPAIEWAKRIERLFQAAPPQSVQPLTPDEPAVPATTIAAPAVAST